MERRIFGQSGVPREEPMQELYDLWVLLAAMYLLCWYTKRQEYVNTQNVGHRQDFIFAFNLDSNYVGKEYNFTK